MVCAYGVLVKEPLLSDYEILNVHPSLLPRWRGAAPVERAIMAGDAETGVAIMRLTAGLDSGPVCLAEREPIRADDDYGSLAARLPEVGGEALVRALDERPPFVGAGRGAASPTRTRSRRRDRALDPTRPPEEVERVVRALRPAHRRAAAAPRRLVPRRGPRPRSTARRSRRPAAACAPTATGCCSTATAARSS